MKLINNRSNNSYITRKFLYVNSDKYIIFKFLIVVQLITCLLKSWFIACKKMSSLENICALLVISYWRCMIELLELWLNAYVHTMNRTIEYWHNLKLIRNMISLEKLNPNRYKCHAKNRIFKVCKVSIVFMKSSLALGL